MAEISDWEERCALSMDVIDRDDLPDAEKLRRIRGLLSGGFAEEEERTHDWVESGMEPLPAMDGGSPGHSMQYRCRRCGARGYRIVFATSVTMYPIVTEQPYCT